MLNQKLQRLHHFRERQRSFLLEIFPGHIQQRRQIAVAKRGTRRIQNARPKKCHRMLEDCSIKRIVLAESWCVSQSLALNNSLSATARQSATRLMQKASCILCRGRHVKPAYVHGINWRKINAAALTN